MTDNDQYLDIIASNVPLQVGQCKERQLLCFSKQMAQLVKRLDLAETIPFKVEHETGIFATFTGKAVRHHGVTFMVT